MAKNQRLIDERDRFIREKEAILARVEPARAEYERLTQNPRIAELKKIIVESKPRLFELENEITALTRAIGPSKGIKIEPGQYSGVLK